MIKPLTLFFLSIFLAAGYADAGSPIDASAGKHQSGSVTRTGVLEARPGYIGSKFGVEVEDVSTISDEVQAIDLMLPFSAKQVDVIEVESVTGEVVDLPKEVDIEPGQDPKIPVFEFTFLNATTGSLESISSIRPRTVKVMQGAHLGNW